MKILSLALLALPLALSLAGCGGSGGAANPDATLTGVAAFRNATSDYNGTTLDIPGTQGASSTSGTTYTIVLGTARTLSISLPTNLAVPGTIVPYTGSLANAVATYREADPLGVARTWRSYSGTVTVLSRANGATILRLNNVAFGPDDATNATRGGFSLVGTVQGADAILN